MPDQKKYFREINLWESEVSFVTIHKYDLHEI